MLLYIHGGGEAGGELRPTYRSGVVTPVVHGICRTSLTSWADRVGEIDLEVSRFIASKIITEGLNSGSIADGGKELGTGGGCGKPRAQW